MKPAAWSRCVRWIQGGFRRGGDAGLGTVGRGPDATRGAVPGAARQWPMCVMRRFYYRGRSAGAPGVDAGTGRRG